MVFVVAMAQMGYYCYCYCCGCCWYDDDGDGRIANVSKRVRSIDLIDRRQALSMVRRCHLVACLKMFLHRLKLAHSSVLFRQQPNQWPDNWRSIWVQLNLNLLPHRNRLVFGCRWWHCCWCWWWCCCCCCCQQIRIDPPNHRRRGCQDFRAHCCWSMLLRRLLLLVHPMPMSFFDATPHNPSNIKRKSTPLCQSFPMHTIDFATFATRFLKLYLFCLVHCRRSLAHSSPFRWFEFKLFVGSGSCIQKFFAQ